MIGAGYSKLFAIMLSLVVDGGRLCPHGNNVQPLTDDSFCRPATPRAAARRRGGAAANALLLRQTMRTLDVLADAERAAGHAPRVQELVQVRERESMSLQICTSSPVSGGAI